MITIISGFQDGVDITAVNVAKEMGYPTAGYAPLGFLAKSGMHPEYRELYGAHETPDKTYPPRTRLNIERSDATLMFAENWNSPGMTLTRDILKETGKPCRAIDVRPYGNFDENQLIRVSQVIWWLRKGIASGWQTLNVAGNSDPRLETQTRQLLQIILVAVKPLP